ncbi:MAG: hypothetical protein RLZ33_907 [Bacteroidota bacterium]
MRFIQREHIDCEKWDALVKSDASVSVFSLSAYLDAVAENWCVFTDEEYTKGIALPFTFRLGVKTCYTAVFLRYVEWIGEQTVQFDKLISLLQAEFPGGQLCIKQDVLGYPSEEFVFQNIPVLTERTINSQAKRMLSKAEKKQFQLEEVDSIQEIQAIISEELPQKIASINDTSLSALEKLTSHLKKENRLRIVAIKDQSITVGGLYLVEFNDTVLYLKGAFTKEAKDAGAMYFAMNEAIKQAQAAGKNFDFGGSRVEGVRRFNVNLGGNDQVYFSYEWNNAPFWFKLLKKARQAWKRK